MEDKDKIKALWILAGTLAFLAVVLGVMLISFYFRYENYKSSCEAKLGELIDKYSDRIDASQKFNITIPVSNVTPVVDDASILITFD